jgi:iron complex outermembrane receptor protein
MNKLGTTLLLFAFMLGTSVFAQQATLSGTLIDGTTDEPLIAATVKAGAIGTVTEFDGTYVLMLDPGEYEVEFRYVGFETITETIRLAAGEKRVIDKALSEEPNILKTATITSGKYEKPLGEVTVSLEVLKPNLIDNTNKPSIADVLGKVPGVDMVGGQANIRGGSGFSYGAGSRVLLLVDDIPILQADAGFPQWNDVPLENISQVEVVKGAASALYGSSALNGIINVRTAYATNPPETRIAPFYTYFMKPKDEYKAWWDETGEQPYAVGMAASHRRKMGKVDLVAGGYYRKNKSTNRDSGTERGRLNANLRYRVTDRLSLGLNSNLNMSQGTSYFFWGNSDSLIYQKPANLALSESDNTRFNIDPFVTYFDNGGNRHKFNGRFFKVKNNTGSVEADQSNKSDVYYAEYQFQKNFKNIGLITTAGVVNQNSIVQAELYGGDRLTSRNTAAYLQFDKKFGDRLNLSAGFRYEVNHINAPDTLKGELTINNFPLPIEVKAGDDSDSRPVLRFGANYRLGKATFLRSSFGQGYRFPTIAEKYIITSFGGGFPIYPNPPLEPETGWSAEFAVKQGFKVSNFQGYLDVAAFWSEYQNMMEFNIPNPPPFGNPLPGFQSVNVGDTRIRGLEITVAGRGSIGNKETTLLMGYTYLDPQFKEWTPIFNDPTIRTTEGFLNAAGSSICNENDDPNRERCQNILKYRFRHTFKLDVETKFNDKLSVGLATLYNSKMLNIDDIFESTIVPGLAEYRMNNNGDLRVNGRIAFYLNDMAKFSLIGENLLNSETTSRPGAIRPPRNITVRADFTF